LYVTHDQEEAFALADRVILIDRGKVIQIGTPEEIFKHPASEIVARFLGFKNIFDCTLHGEVLRTPIGNIQISDAEEVLSITTRGKAIKTVLFRPDGFRLSSTGSNKISGVVKGVTFRGNLSSLLLNINGHEMRFEFNTTLQLPKPGENINLHFDPQDAIQIL
jgi:ABC-type Fe3+/spermidine/putrescine transport system ATPase subunit